MTDFLLKEIESTVQCSKNLKCWKEKKNKNKKQKPLISVDISIFNENIFFFKNKSETIILSD